MLVILMLPAVSQASDQVMAPSGQIISEHNPIYGEEGAPVDEGYKPVVCLSRRLGPEWRDPDPRCQPTVEREKKRGKIKSFISSKSVEQGTSFFFGVTNNTNQTYMLRDSAPWHIEKMDKRDRGTVVYAPYAFMATVPLRPGETKSWYLFVNSDYVMSHQGANLEPGKYQVVIDGLNKKLKFKVVKGESPFKDYPPLPILTPIPAMLQEPSIDQNVDE